MAIAKVRFWLKMNFSLKDEKCFERIITEIEIHYFFDISRANGSIYAQAAEQNDRLKITVAKESLLMIVFRVNQNDGN